MSDISPPEKIRIMADYGCYAWDERGVCIYLACYFAGNEKIIKIEAELEKWSDEFWKIEDDEGDDLSFPWDSFHRRGFELCKQLAAAIPPDISIDISYDPPFEDPTRREMKPIYLRHRKND